MTAWKETTRKYSWQSVQKELWLFCRQTDLQRNKRVWQRKELFSSIRQRFELCFYVCVDIKVHGREPDMRSQEERKNIRSSIESLPDSSLISISLPCTRRLRCLWHKTGEDAVNMNSVFPRKEGRQGDEHGSVFRCSTRDKRPHKLRKERSRQLLREEEEVQYVTQREAFGRKDQKLFRPLPFSSFHSYCKAIFHVSLQREILCLHSFPSQLPSVSVSLRFFDSIPGKLLLSCP